MPPVVRWANLWDSDYFSSPQVTLDCLMPNGVLIQMDVARDSLLSEIKDMLWHEAQNYPLYELLKGKNTYVFQCINQVAEKVELPDESRRLCDVKPFQPVLIVIEKVGDSQEKQTNSKIGILIGKGLHEFDQLTGVWGDEVDQFRKTMRSEVESIARARDKESWDAKLRYQFGSAQANEERLPACVQTQLQLAFGGKLNVKVHINETQEYSACYKFDILQPDETANNLILRVQERRPTLPSNRNEGADNYLLKTVGLTEFLYGRQRIYQSPYVRRQILKGEEPSFILVTKASVKDMLFTPIPSRRPAQLHHASASSIRSRHSPASSKYGGRPPARPGSNLWQNTHSYKLTAQKVKNLGWPEGTKAHLRLGLYHGAEPVCAGAPYVDTDSAPLCQGLVDWSQLLHFDIALQNIPRMTRLCVTLVVLMDKRNKRMVTSNVSTMPRIKDKERKVEIIAVAWVSIPLFDYKDELLSGKQTLYLWSYNEDDNLNDYLLNPIGTVGSNPHSDSAVSLTLTFEDYEGVMAPIYYPDDETVMEVAACNQDQFTAVQRHQLEPLKRLLERDPLQELCEQDKEKIWKVRQDCFDHFSQSSLPKLLLCVEWNNHVSVAQMRHMLNGWPTLEFRKALELLDFKYADKHVRNFAVRSLEQSMTDEDLQDYLLQLVQVLKYESYLECELVTFLLRRSLRNLNLGHHFFWLIRSEMHFPSVSVRFGLILEAYCRGAIHHMDALSKQLEALDCFKQINMHFKSDRYKDFSTTKSVRETACREMRNCLAKNERIFGMCNTLNPSVVLLKPISESCKVMDSKMRPLWLSWQNSDSDQSSDSSIIIMFKNGDDLRQDMLTLQMLRIMDKLWKQNGLDLRLNIYECIATGCKQGLIGPVRHSATLAGIQRRYGGGAKGAFARDSLYKYLKQHNQTAAGLDAAMDQFLLSCAGYCVATYVLGIGDRHSGNIMLKENGQLFHIDFGHILGNFKKWKGVNRERTRFVLTTHFEYVINRGPEKQFDQFNKFRALCIEAYMVLRREANFIMTLFTMMLNTGIPELSSMKSIEWLGETFMTCKTDKAAEEHFVNTFNDALKRSYFTSMNWFVHNAAKNS